MSLRRRPRRHPKAPIVLDGMDRPELLALCREIDARRKAEESARLARLRYILGKERETT